MGEEAERTEELEDGDVMESLLPDMTRLLSWLMNSQLLNCCYPPNTSTALGAVNILSQGGPTRMATEVTTPPHAAAAPFLLVVRAAVCSAPDVHRGDHVCCPSSYEQ